jgi:hypothetical protein
MEQNLIALGVILLLIVVVLAKTAVIVPQRSEYVVQRLGKYRTTLTAGFHILFPFFDIVAYKRSLKEEPIDISAQTCITADNVTLEVDGILYFGTFDGKLVGLDHKTGTLEWEFQTELSKQNYPTIYNKEGHFKDDFVLYGDDYVASEAKIHELGSILSTPVIEDKIIYFGSSDGYFYAVKLE